LTLTLLLLFTDFDNFVQWDLEWRDLASLISLYSVITMCHRKKQNIHATAESISSENTICGSNMEPITGRYMALKRASWLQQVLKMMLICIRHTRSIHSTDQWTVFSTHLTVLHVSSCGDIYLSVRLSNACILTKQKKNLSRFI